MMRVHEGVIRVFSFRTFESGTGAPHSKTLARGWRPLKKLRLWYGGGREDGWFAALKDSSPSSWPSPPGEGMAFWMMRAHEDVIRVSSRETFESDTGT